MYLYGASGHAKVIIDILKANHESVEALFPILIINGPRTSDGRSTG